MIFHVHILEILYASAASGDIRPLPLPLGWTMSSATAVRQLRPNVPPSH